MNAIDSEPAGRTRPPVIRLEGVARAYRAGRNRAVQALRGVDMIVQPGEFVAVLGPSGSGKSTLLNILGCLDTPTQGRYWLDGLPVSRLSRDQRATIRNRKIGFIFQGFNLLPRANSLSNVLLPLLYAGIVGRPAEQLARAALEQVGLADRATHRPAELSGGQQQRVAIARALVNRPSLLLADEPTGNLDQATSLEVMEVLRSLNERRMTIVLVTHEPDIAAFSRRRITFQDGRLVDDSLAQMRASTTISRSEVTSG